MERLHQSEELISKSDVLALAKEMYHPHGNLMIIFPEDVEKLKPKKNKQGEII